jgi:hypothetical protein
MSITCRLYDSYLCRFVQPFFTDISIKIATVGCIDLAQIHGIYIACLHFSVEFYNEKVKFKITDMYIQYTYICIYFTKASNIFKKCVYIYSSSKYIALLRNIDIGIVLYLF